MSHKIEEAARLVSKIYDYHIAGGNAHIVVDDLNVEDSHINFCLSYLNSEDSVGDDEQKEVEREALNALLQLTETERLEAIYMKEHYSVKMTRAFKLPLLVEFPDNTSEYHDYMTWVATRYREHLQELTLIVDNIPEHRDYILSRSVNATIEDYEEQICIVIAEAMLELHERGYPQNTELVFVPVQKYLDLHFKVLVT